MPVKKIDDLKDPIDRQTGQAWQKALDVPNLTTRELDYVNNYHQDGTDEELREIILNRRNNKK